MLNTKDASGVAEGVGRSAATPRIILSVSTAAARTEADGSGEDRLALAAIQWKVRSGGGAASGAATHHVMHGLQMSLLGGPSPGSGSPTLLVWGPTPPPGSLTGADASGQHGCVSRYSLEAAPTRPPTLPLARPRPAVAAATPRIHDRALASPVPSPPARQRGDTTRPRLPRGVPGCSGLRRRRAQASWQPCVDGGKASLAACPLTQLRCSCQSPHLWEPVPNGPAVRADRGGRVRHACACATTPASSHACSSSTLPQRACKCEHAHTIQTGFPRRTTGTVGPGASGLGHAPPRAGPYTAVVMAALAGCPHEVPAAAYGVAASLDRRARVDVDRGRRVPT